MPTAQQITDFETAVAKLNSDLSTASTNQSALDKSNSALAAAQADVGNKTTATQADGTALQADLDDINVKGAALGLKVNVPAAVGAAVSKLDVPPPIIASA